MIFKRLLLSQTFIRNISSSSNKLEELPETLSKLLFTDKHEWVMVNGNVGTVGISDYAQKALGDIVYAQLPDINTNLKQKEECGALESVKAASEIYSPVSGKVVEKNIEVEENPSLINKSCYNKGWLFKLELSNENEIKQLMPRDKYLQFLKADSEIAAE